MLPYAYQAARRLGSVGAPTAQLAPQDVAYKARTVAGSKSSSLCSSWKRIGSNALQRASVLSARRYSSRVELYEEEEKDEKKVTTPFTNDFFGTESTEDEWSVSAEDSLEMDEQGWSDWHESVRPFIEKLHTPKMTLSLAKELWSAYKEHVSVHPEIAAFLRIMFRQLGPYLYFDHLETLYYDIVATKQLTTVIGRNMVQQYLQRADFESAESVVADLRAANLDVSGSTVSMMVRLAGYSGNERKVWEYFDAHVQTPAFAQSSYAYLCGSLFIALNRLPGSQEAHVTSIFQLMMSTEEYYPNSPEYYRWLEAHNAHPSQAEALVGSLHQETLGRMQAGDVESVAGDLHFGPSTQGMPDFPMQPPVRLPAPDAFCCNVVFPALRTVEAAQSTWEYVQKLRRVTPSVYANYICCLLRIDLQLAIKAFKEFLLTSYSKKSNSTTARLRLALMKRATELADLEALQEVIAIQTASSDLRAEDIVNLAKVKLRRGTGGREVLKEAIEMHDAHKLSSLAFILRCIILECLQRSMPEPAVEALSYAKELGWKLHYHHQTPIPLWYFHKWLAAREANAAAKDISAEAKARENELEAKFLEMNEIIFSSEVGPSAFYIRVVATLHPSYDTAKKIMERVLDMGQVTAAALVFSIANSNAPLPFDRSFRLVKDLCSHPHNGVFSPIVAKPLITWGSSEDKFKECFEIAQIVITNAMTSFREGAQVAEEEQPTTSFIRGSWVHHFSSLVLYPQGINTYLHKYYGFHKYQALTKDQTMELQENLQRAWMPRARRNNFKRQRPSTPPPQHSTTQKRTSGAKPSTSAPRNNFSPQRDSATLDPRSTTPQL